MLLTPAEAKGLECLGYGPLKGERVQTVIFPCFCFGGVEQEMSVEVGGEDEASTKNEGENEPT